MTKTQQLLSTLQKHLPQANIKAKSSSLLMRFLGKVMFFSPGFMTNFITTIGYTSYFPDALLGEEYDYGNVEVLSHEFVHMWDYNKNKFFGLLYIIPQIFAIFTLLICLAALSHWWLLALLCLLFLLPLPAYWRMKYELRGYTMSLAVNYWRNGNSFGTGEEAFYIDQFVNSGYYFMWPFRSDMTKRFDQAKKSIEMGTLLNDEPYKIVYDWIKANY